MRVIRLGGQAPPDVVRSIGGYSSAAGRTTRSSSRRRTCAPTIRRATWRAGRSLLSRRSKVTERFTRVSPTELFYRFTVEDDELYTRPWSGEFSMTRFDQPIYEYACHEANYSLTNILRGGRAQF